MSVYESREEHTTDYSIVIPVYFNECSIANTFELINTLVETFT